MWIELQTSRNDNVHSISALVRHRQGGLCDFKAILVYIANEFLSNQSYIVTVLKQATTTATTAAESCMPITI